MGHGHYFHIPAVFALIRKDYKFFYWPQTNYEQLFHVETDSYEEWDVVNSTAQTTTEALTLMKARYQFMKEWAQSGKPV
jgi:arylsulfatase